MSFDEDERAQDWLRDIIDNSGWIATYIDGMTLEQFVADRMTRDAAERCLERVIEASVRLGPDSLPGLPPITRFTKCVRSAMSCVTPTMPSMPS